LPILSLAKLLTVFKLFFISEISHAFGKSESSDDGGPGKLN